MTVKSSWRLFESGRVLGFHPQPTPFQLNVDSKRLRAVAHLHDTWRGKGLLEWLLPKSLQLHVDCVKFMTIYA